MEHERASGTTRLAAAGIALGLSLGGFFDGIMLHQVLQWHHMLTSVEDPAISGDISLNMMADGFFHVATWIFAIVGLVLLWHARSSFGRLHWARTFVGSILIGAGLFNLVEGLIDHQILGIHHVRTDSPHLLLWDIGFLALGLLLVVVGWVMRRSAAEPETATPPRAAQLYAAAGHKPSRPAR